MRNEDYVVIQGWMANLGLTDKQLKVYALIWGFSRDGFSRMRGSARYIADWAGCHVKHAQRIIRELLDRGLIGHEVVAWSNGKKGGVVTEFWAILPEYQAAPAPGTRGRVEWSGKNGGYLMEEVSPILVVILYKNYLVVVVKIPRAHARGKPPPPVFYLRMDPGSRPEILRCCRCLSRSATLLRGGSA